MILPSHHWYFNPTSLCSISYCKILWSILTTKRLPRKKYCHFWIVKTIAVSSFTSIDLRCVFGPKFYRNKSEGGCSEAIHDHPSHWEMVVWNLAWLVVGPVSWPVASRGKLLCQLVSTGNNNFLNWSIRSLVIEIFFGTFKRCEDSCRSVWDSGFWKLHVYILWHIWYCQISRYICENGKEINKESLENVFKDEKDAMMKIMLQSCKKLFLDTYDSADDFEHQNWTLTLCKVSSSSMKIAFTLLMWLKWNVCQLVLYKSYQFDLNISKKSRDKIVAKILRL